MKEELNELMIKEYDSLCNLGELLKKQHEFCIKKDVFELDAIVKKIEENNVVIGKYEIERRKLTQNRPIKDIVKELNDHELNDNFMKLRDIVLKVKTQNNLNQYLIKSGLMFTNRILSIINPDRSAKVYNNYGKIK